MSELHVYDLSFRFADETGYNVPAIVFTVDRRIWPELRRRVNRFLESTNATALLKNYVETNLTYSLLPEDPTEGCFGFGDCCRSRDTECGFEVHVDILDKDHKSHACLMIELLCGTIHRGLETKYTISNRPQPVTLDVDFTHIEATAFHFFHPSGYLTGEMVEYIRHLEGPDRVDAKMPDCVIQAMLHVWDRVGDHSSPRVRALTRAYDGIRLGPYDWELDESRNVDDWNRIYFEAGWNNMFPEHMLTALAGLAMVCEVARRWSKNTGG